MLLTRPPLTPKGAFDLHVLRIPPAFILSQDQTLHVVNEFVAPKQYFLLFRNPLSLLCLGFKPKTKFLLTRIGCLFGFQTLLLSRFWCVAGLFLDTLLV